MNQPSGVASSFGSYLWTSAKKCWNEIINIIITIIAYYRYYCFLSSAFCALNRPKDKSWQA